MNPPDSLRLDDELARLLKAYDQGIGDADGDAPTLHIDKLPPELLKLLEGDAAPCEVDAAPRSLPEALPGSVTETKSHRVGRFELRRLLGRGGFGIVFLAFDPKLQREVALKIPRPEMLLSADARRRLAREALAAAGFDHPNLVPVYETGEIGPVCFIATGYCQGETLAHWLDRQAFPVPVRQAARLVAILAEAVQHAHYRGVLHRDLKPNNVLLQVVKTDPNEQEPAPGSCVLRGERFLPRVVDFGLAKVAERSTSDTGAQQIVGTPRYMAPEQAQARQDEIGPTADVYALGVILYELLTGRAPYDGETDLEVLRQSIEGNLTHPRTLRTNIPRDLEAICLKAMARKPADRYRTALDLADDLRRFLNGLPTSARPLGKRSRLLKWLRRNDELVALLFVTSLALFFLIVGTWSGYQHRQLRVDRDNVLKTNRLQDRDRMYAQAVRHAYQYWRAGDALPMAASLEEAKRLAGVMAEAPCFAHDFIARLATSPTRLHSSPHGPATSLGISADGERWATGHEDGTLALWDAASGRVLSATPRSSEPLIHLAIEELSPMRIFTAATDGVRIWNVSSEGKLQENGWIPLPERVRSLSSTRDHSRVLIGTSEGWSWLDSSSRSTKFNRNAAGMDGEIALSPDGRTIAVSEGEACQLRDTSTGEVRQTLPGRAGRMCFLPKGIALLQKDDNLVRGFSREGRAEGLIATPPGRVNRLRSSDDGELVVTTGNESSLCVWDRRRGSLRQVLQGHSLRVLSAEFRPTSRTLVSTAEDGTIAVWNLDLPPAGPIAQERTTRVKSVHHDSKGKHCWVAFADGSIECAGLDRPIRSPHRMALDALRPTGGGLMGLEFTPRKLTCRMIGAEERTVFERSATDANFTAFDLSDDGSRLIAGDDHGRVVIWSTWTGQEMGVHQAEATAVIRSVNFTSEGTWVGIREVKGRFGMVSPQGQGSFLPIGTETDPTPMLRHFADAQRFAITGRGSAIKICELDGRVRATLIGHTGEVTRVALTPNGRVLASGSSTGEVKLWDVRTSQELLGLRCHAGPITHLEFSPDGQRLLSAAATADGKGEYAIWDAK